MNNFGKIIYFMHVAGDTILMLMTLALTAHALHRTFRSVEDKTVEGFNGSRLLPGK